MLTQCCQNKVEDEKLNGFKVQGEIQNSLWMGVFKEEAPTYHFSKKS